MKSISPYGVRLIFAVITLALLVRLRKCSVVVCAGTMEQTGSHEFELLKTCNMLLAISCKGL